MTKKKNTVTKLVTVSKCARMLSEKGARISRQGLAKYAKHHGLIRETRPNGWLMVSFEEMSRRRQDFTREVMRGEHSTTPASSAKNKPRAEWAAIKPTPPLTSVGGGAVPVSSLDQARIAKTRKEEAQADAAELDLYERTNNVLATAEVELLLGLLMTLLKESLLGVNLTDDTEEILQVLNLPDEMRQPTKSILKNRRRDLLSKFGNLAKQELSRLDPDHSGDLPARFHHLLQKLQSMRDGYLKRKTRRPTAKT